MLSAFQLDRDVVQPLVNIVGTPRSDLAIGVQSAVDDPTPKKITRIDHKSIPVVEVEAPQKSEIFYRPTFINEYLDEIRFIDKETFPPVCYVNESEKRKRRRSNAEERIWSHELVLDDFEIVDYSGTGYDQLVCSRPKTKKYRPHYFVAGSLQPEEAMWSERGWFKIDTDWTLETPSAPEKENKIWITAPLDRTLNIRLGTPAPGYAAIYKIFSVKCHLASKLPCWISAHKHVNMDDLNGRSPTSFLGWCDQHANLGKNWTDSLLRDVNLISADGEKIGHENFRNVIEVFGYFILAFGLLPHNSKIYKSLIQTYAYEDVQPKEKQAKVNEEFVFTPLIEKIFNPDPTRLNGKISIIDVPDESSIGSIDRRTTIVIPEEISDALNSETAETTTLEFPGEPIKEIGDLVFYDSMSLRGETYRLGDDVVVWASDEESRHASKHPIWVAKVYNIIWKTKGGRGGEGVVELVWYYFLDGSSMFGKLAEHLIDYREIMFSNDLEPHWTNISATAIISKAVIHHEIDHVKGWNEFFCNTLFNYKADSHDHVSYEPSMTPTWVEKMEDGKRYLVYREKIPSPGEVWAFTPTDKKSTIMEIWHIMSISDNEAMGRRFYPRRSAMNDQGEKAEYLYDIHVVTIDNFGQRLQHDVNMEYVHDEQDRLTWRDLPIHLQPSFNGAGKTAFFRRLYNSDEKVLVNVTGAPTLSKTFPCYTLLQNDDPPPLATFEIFAGVGGSAYGLDLSGATVSRWALDINAGVLETNKENRVHGDNAFCTINGDASTHLKKAYQLHRYGKPKEKSRNTDVPLPGQVELLVAGPPCQGWSSLNRNTDNEKAQGNQSQYWVTLSWVDFLKPSYVLIENVFNLAKFTDETKQHHIKKIVYAFHVMGYQVRPFAMSGKQHGLAQARDRLFFLAVKRGFPMPDMAPVTHLGVLRSRSIGGLDCRSRIPGITPVDYGMYDGTSIWDVIGRLPKLGDNGMQPCFLDLDHCVVPPLDTRCMHSIRHLQPGESMADLAHKTDEYGRNLLLFQHGNKGRTYDTLISAKRYKKYLDRRNFSQGAMLKRHRKKGHVATIITDGDPKLGGLHPVDLRPLSVREKALLQSFPISFRFLGPHEHRHKAIGNAVAPAVSFAIGVEIRASRKYRGRQSDAMDVDQLDVASGSGSRVDSVDGLWVEV